MAVSACNAYAAPANGACQQISVSDWARMDADNAAPWLLLAGQARAKNDMAAEADAFDRAAQAHRINSYSDSLSGVAESELPTDATALERWYFSIELIGIESASVLPQYSVASKHCSVEAMQDSQRVQLGEVGAARDALERSGESVQELAQKQKEFIEKIRRDALAQ
jgi:hypothetical protein